MNIHKLIENVAAISDTVHTHKDFQKFYADVCNQVGGFPGIWQLCGQAGLIFTQIEEAWGQDWENGNYIDNITAFAEEIVENCLVNESDLKSRASYWVKL